MRLFKPWNKFNWKYIIGEILLISMGISLAIWFNNWNSSMKSKREKEVIIKKIKEEIKNNIEETNKSRVINQKIIDAYSDYKALYKGNTNEVVSTPQHLKILQGKYPNYFKVTDSPFFTFSKTWVKLCSFGVSSCFVNF